MFAIDYVLHPTEKQNKNMKEEKNKNGKKRNGPAQDSNLGTSVKCLGTYC